MLRLFAWTVWVILFIPVIYLNVFKLPFRLTMTKGQMIVLEVRTAGSNIPRNYVVGTIKGRKKPVALSIHRLKTERTPLGSQREFIDKYVNTGLPLDVVVGTQWMSSYDVAAPDIKPSKYSISELFAIDFILLFILVVMYLYLRHTAPPSPPPPPSYINQLGGF